MDWQPIETLPFDDIGKYASPPADWGIGWSEDCLLYIPSIPNEFHRIVVGRLEGGDFLQMDATEDGTMTRIEGAPSHWMPLPPPPQEPAA
jgi:hypothetical protein